VRIRIVAVAGAVLVGAGALIYNALPTYIPHLSVAPAITGTAQIGESLFCGQGTWGNTPTAYTISYDSSANGSTGWSLINSGNPYVLSDSGQVGKYLRCHVKASNGAGGANAYSSNVGPVSSGSAGVFVQDSFTGSDSTNLTAHTGEIGATWTKHPNQPGSARDILITSNQARGDGNTSTISRYYASGTPPTADYAVEATLNAISATTNERAGIWARMNTSTDDGYELTYQRESTRWALYKVVSGTATLLGSYTDVFSDGSSRTIRLELRGTALTVLIDGTQRITATDSTFASAGSVGILTRSSTATTGIHIDNLVATTIVAPPPPPPPPPDGTLDVSVAGSGTVTSDVGGISCPGTCSHAYSSTTVVTLTEAPALGYTFAGWGGADCSGTAPTCVVTVTPGSGHSASATFDPPAPSNTYNEFVDATGSDSGTNCVRFSTPIGAPSDPATYCRTFDKAYQLASLGDLVQYSGNFGSNAGTIVPKASFEPGGTTCSSAVNFYPKPGTTPAFTTSEFVIKGDCVHFFGPFTGGSFSIDAASTGDRPEDVLVDGISNTLTTAYYALDFTGSANARYQNIFSNGQGIICGGGSRPAPGQGWTNSSITYDHIRWYGCTKPSHAADCLHPYNDGTDSMTVSNNWFEHCDSLGLLFDDTTDRYSDPADQPPSLIENNRFSIMPSSPIQLMNPGTHHMWNVTIRFNSMPGGIALTPETTGTYNNVKIYGNITKVTSSASCQAHTGVTFSYDLTFRETAGSGCAYAGTGNVYMGVVTAGYANLWAVNPLNPNVGNFHLSDISLALGVADGAASFPATDYEGNPRPDGLLDPGASEHP
jgi:hypothetical protein